MLGAEDSKSTYRSRDQYLHKASTQHFFLFRNAPLNKPFVWSRLKTLSKQAGIRVYAHRLRHTTATQLLNAGCRVTFSQTFLGHKSLNTTWAW